LLLPTFNTHKSVSLSCFSRFLLSIDPHTECTYPLLFSVSCIYTSLSIHSFALQPIALPYHQYTNTPFSYASNNKYF
jgi:hypothetical protein